MNLFDGDPSAPAPPSAAEDRDRFWMRRALVEARRGQGRVEPNPMVGAVLVQGGQTVGVGYHRQCGGPHAEVEAIRDAGAAARGTTLYVTLEPCCHFGKTPPCTEAVLEAGISRVVVAMGDPFPKVAGGGIARLRGAGLEVEVGLEAEEARRLNAPYLKRLLTGLPYVTAKWAMTLDGKIATSTGDSKWISGARSRALVHEVRGRMDAIAVGIGTVLADDPLLTPRPPGPRTPARLVLDSRARLPVDCRLARTIGLAPVWVAVSEDADEDRLKALADVGCEILRLPCAGSIAVRPLLQELAERGVTNLLVEGGSRVLGSFMDAGQIDYVDVFVSPLLEGGSHGFGPVQGEGVSLMAQALRLERSEITIIDNDVRISGVFPVPWLRENDSP